MKVTLMPKDVSRALILEDVVCYFFGYDTLHVFFSDGTIREYPARHIWYAEAKKDENPKG